MKLAVSNIAWSKDEEPEIAALLKRLGIKYVEVAPTKQWDDPTQASDDEITAYKDFWHSFDIEVVAFQSMLFSRSNLKIFESTENRAETLAYLQDFVGLADKMDAQAMVFGSPKNRQRGEMSEVEANKIATEFFGALGDTAASRDVHFCIEPNAPQYGCDFITNAQQGIDLVKAIGNPGLGLHLDIACMTLAGDDVRKSITNAADILRHFHISSPMLEQVESREDVHHTEAAAALQDIDYRGFVSIEMRPGDADQNAVRVEKAVRFAQGVYA